MQPRIETFTEKKLIGKRITMSLADNRTSELWRSFMPRRKDISNNAGTDLYSVSIYDTAYFRNFNPQATFEKWAATEVNSLDYVPTEMETLILPDGMYAVFLYKGPASAGDKTFLYIYSTWIPQSDFVLDNRPHFEILGEKYKNEHPDSEEEIWIPVKPKA